MFTIYSDKTIFEDIISSPGVYPNWNKIINDHSIVYLDINQIDLDAEMTNPDLTILFLFLQANARDIKLIPSDNYFQTIYKNLETVIENTTSAYFLNLSIDAAKKLQEDTGIIINCNDKIDDELLLRNKYDDWFADETKTNNWKNLLKDFENFPSNSIIINDRNLFSNDEKIGNQYFNLGINNVLRILDAILPKKINIEYHIIIQTDQQINRPGLENKVKCDEISNFLNLEIRRLRPYNFIIEMVFIHSSTEHYAHTHNRRLLSNYNLGSMLHSFSAFKIRTPDKTRNDEKIQIIAIFDKINTFSNNYSNLKEYDIGVHRFKEITAHCISKINQLGPNDKFYRYYLNGVEVIQGQATIINNRLLN